MDILLNIGLLNVGVSATKRIWTLTSPYKFPVLGNPSLEVGKYFMFTFSAPARISPLTEMYASITTDNPNDLSFTSIYFKHNVRQTTYKKLMK